MKKNHILVHLVEPPENDRQLAQAYRAMFGRRLHPANTPEAQKGRLAENVWLLDRDDDFHVFALIVSQAEEYHIDCKVRFLSDD